MCIRDSLSTESIMSGDYNNGVSDGEADYNNGETEDSDGVEQYKLNDVMQLILDTVSTFLRKIQVKKAFLKQIVINKLVELRGFLSSDVFLEETNPGKFFFTNNLYIGEGSKYLNFYP